jgi:adenylate cyclase
MMQGQFEIPLETIGECFQGAVPASICTASLDGTPNATYLSIVQRVDSTHVALSRQFFNKTVVNLRTNQRCQAMIVDPTTGHQFRLDLIHERLESEGPLFERMRVQLEAVASQTGMAGVFKLQAVDVCKVLQCRAVPAPGTPAAEPKRPQSDVGALAAFSRRVMGAASVDELITESLVAFDECLGFNHSLLLALDELTPDRLYTIGSRGFSLSGVGSEVRLGQGVIGVAVASKRAIRIGHMEFERTYSRAVRSVVERDGAGQSLEQEIPLPGLPGARSHMAAPILVHDRPLGALYFQSEEYARFHDDDESVLTIAAHEIALAWTVLRFAPAAITASPPAQARPQVQPGEVKYYAADDSVFIDNEYLIKGVPGRILWTMLKKYAAERRIDFTNREMRLDPQLELPALHENLETRLILLRKRLEERCDYLHLVSTGRGRFRLLVEREIRLQEVTA